MRRCLLATLIAISVNCPVHARPAHKQALAQYFGAYLPKKLNDCRTCHLPDPPEKKADDEAEKPHNLFGLRLKAVRAELRKAGKSATIEASLDLILDEDSDGDGVSNRDEILTGHFPGDKADCPTPEEIARAKTLRAEFAKARTGHPWRPFEVVKQPPIPKIRDAAWMRNPIDAFIAAEHEALGLTPRPPARPEVLLRRLYLDLIGLPPTPAEIEQFTIDCGFSIGDLQSEIKNQKSKIGSVPDKIWSKWVDRLLADPRHGERWARHWMDIWRYSDWAGYGPQVRDSQPHIWRWRDWIIESLNTDQGYDRMLEEMLAGDELAPEDPTVLTATGYLVRNWKLLSREKWIQDTVEHTAQAFLGITLQCAKCHDHMYDPIAQKEYYQFRAIFEPHDVRTDRIPGQPDIKLDGIPRVFDKNLDVKTVLFIRGDDRTPDKTPLAPAVPEAFGGALRVAAVTLPSAAVSPDKRSFVLKELVEQSALEIGKAKTALMNLEKQKGPDATATKAAGLSLASKQASHEALLRVLEAEKLEDAGKAGSDEWKKIASAALTAQRLAAVAQAKHALHVAEQKAAAKQSDTAQGKAAQKALAAAQMTLDKAEKEAQQPPSTQYQKRAGTSFPAQSTGRRLALARWLSSRDNPLTARVAVNHIWLRHFGQAIVPTVADFGKNGRPPSHPALLDWLAAEFMDPAFSPGSQNRAGQWSMKHLHRLIVTSSAYRMASTPDAHNASIDRDNKYLWRFPAHRLEAEAVRDSIFYVAGKLDPKMGGPDIDYPLGLTVPRRSLYFRHAAEKEMEFLTIFDSASVNECYERKHSIVPQQALALINSEVTLKHARILARAIAGKTNGDATAFVTQAFLQVLSRQPTATETTECVTFLQEQTRRFQESKVAGSVGLTPDGSMPAPDPALRARENLVHVLMNHHEFVTIR